MLTYHARVTRCVYMVTRWWGWLPVVTWMTRCLWRHTGRHHHGLTTDRHRAPDDVVQTPAHVHHRHQHQYQHQYHHQYQEVSEFWASVVDRHDRRHIELSLTHHWRLSTSLSHRTTSLYITHTHRHTHTHTHSSPPRNSKAISAFFKRPLIVKFSKFCSESVHGNTDWRCCVEMS